MRMFGAAIFLAHESVLFGSRQDTRVCFHEGMLACLLRAQNVSGLALDAILCAVMEAYYSWRAMHRTLYPSALP